jgi:ElaB/YqjD/DUF883 family membrane-anchored ribosome-binding protein
MPTLTSLLDEKASRIAGQVDDLGREAAASLHAAASTIRKGGHKGSKALEDLAEGAASRLDGAGSYVKKHDLKHTISESRQIARRYPVESLALAACVGFLTGFTIRRLTHVCTRTVAQVSN